MTSIDLCRKWVKIGEVNGGTFAGVARANALGEFTAAAPRAAINLSSAATLADVDTIRVSDSGSIQYAGLVGANPGDQRGGMQVVSDGLGTRVTFTGPDLWGLLARRRCFPTPTTLPPWADSHHTGTGAAGLVAAEYIERNAGVTALPGRRMNLTVSTSPIGTVDTWSARLQRLDDQVARVCNDGGIVCRPTLDPVTLAPVFRFGTVADRTASIIFSDRGDIARSEVITRKASTTWQIVGGQGQLTAREFRYAEQVATGDARAEDYGEFSNLASTTELAAAASTRLAASASTTTATATLLASAAQRIRYGIDYQLGDIVAVDIDGVRYPLRVEGVLTEVTSAGVFLASPQLGRGSVSDLAALLASVDDLRTSSRSTIA